jgi:peptidoglycan/xylan/chitin deacetylase (PgdA/CDA1 family)
MQKSKTLPIIEKAVIVFDRGYENQFTVAKLILDKYDSSIVFVICSFVEGSGYHKLADGSELLHAADNAMNWDQIRQLHKEGHDIESHGKEHRDLRHLSSDELKDEIAGSKECLEDYDLKPVFFQFPNNRGADNSTVLNWYQNTLILVVVILDSCF